MNSIIVNQLVTIGIIFDNENWLCMVTTISNSVGKGKLKLSKFVSLILTKEVRMKSPEIASSSSGLGSALSF